MKYIIDYIVVFFDWIIDIFKSIGLLIYNVLMIIVACGNFLIDVIVSLPTLLIVPCVALVICCILYKVLGREGGEGS